MKDITFTSRNAISNYWGTRWKTMVSVTLKAVKVKITRLIKIIKSIPESGHFSGQLDLSKKPFMRLSRSIRKLITSRPHTIWHVKISCTAKFRSFKKFMVADTLVFCRRRTFYRMSMLSLKKVWKMIHRNAGLWNLLQARKVKVFLSRTTYRVSLSKTDNM